VDQKNTYSKTVLNSNVVEVQKIKDADRG